MILRRVIEVTMAIMTLKVCEVSSANLISLTSFNRCQWVIDLSSTKEPDRVLATYFNEKGLFDVKDKLQDPDITNFLQPVERGNGVGYFVFPYFIIIRATCDSGYYDDSYYRLIMNGDYPTIVMRYWPATSRMAIRRSLIVTSTGALINVQPDEENIEVPLNPNAPHCYMSMCYPSFVVPLVFLHTPIFEVTVEAVDEFSKSKTKIHVSPFHSRKGDNPEDIVLGDLTTQKRPVPAADLYFPTDRIGDIEDPNGISEEVIKDLADDEHYPLDKEDFIEPQYTYGSSPVILFSGFYQPDLIILADPDLHDMHLVRWARNPLLANKSDDNATIFDHGLSCNLRHHYYEDEEYPIPYFTRGEGTMKTDWLGTYYRKRFQPMRYHNFPAPHAIYEAISLEDRILLVTNSGLVVLYGDTNATMTADSALKATGDEKLRKCFKIVRSSRFAYQEADIIVAVTYNYTELKTYSLDDKPITTAEDVDQEIFMGKLTKLGHPIQWNKLGATADTDYGTPQEDTKDSQTKAICHLTVNKYFTLDREIEIMHCVVIDAVPVSGLQETIQVMVEMTILHKPTLDAMSSTDGAQLNMLEKEALVTFYILAQYKPLTTYSKQIWNIVTILPRRPCVESHKQSVQNIENYDTNTYFNHDKTNDTLDINSFKKSCHYAFRNRMADDLHIKRMTYTRQNDGQLFLYGNKLIHSTNKGEAFATLPGFPSEEESKQISTAAAEFIVIPEADREKKFDEVMKMSRSHVIKVMAFGNGGFYAFLTSKRYLYWGSTGTLRLMQLRPSPGYSMIRTFLSNKPGLHDGRPFSLLFDSDDKLFEVVAIVDSDKKVVGIRKREIPWVLITKNNNFVAKLHGNVQKVSKGNKTISAKVRANVFASGNQKFKTYCPYGDPNVFQNYTSSVARAQHITIRSPLQHMHLGTASTQSALMAFQAAAYSLIHVTYLDPEEQRFSHIAEDPLQEWVAKSRKESEIGFFKFFVGDPHKYGIIVDPSSYKRMDDSGTTASKEMPEKLILDYNQVVQVDISFAVTTTAAIDKTNFRIQTLGDLQLTVDNGNGTVVGIETDRKIIANKGIVTFTIYISVDQQAKLPQNFPGINPTIVPLSFHFINAFQNCVPESEGSYIGDSIHTSVYAGCPAASELQLNWNDTLRSLRFRNPNEWMGKPGDCLDNEPVCFYVKIPVTLFFDVFDSAKQNYVPYGGKYTLRIIGGGYSKDSIWGYNEGEQERYNIPGKSDVSLIWSEWDQQNKRKVDIKRDFEDLDSEEIILLSGKSAIKWTCNALSPCSRVLPTWRLQTIYYFKLRISNRGIDKDTLCLHEKDFVIQLYGFSPSPEIQLLLSLLFCFIILLLLYIMYMCCRSNRRVWKANKIKIYGWMQIILDTVPTSKTYSDTSKEMSEQLRRDEIIFSLQGHLRVPVGIPPSKPREPPALKRASKSSKKTESSSSSRSTSSDESKDDIKIQKGTLPRVHARHAPATWTDMIYDQIITKRLNAIIERNDKMKESILKKVEMSDMLKNSDDTGNPKT